MSYIAVPMSFSRWVVAIAIWLPSLYCPSSVSAAPAVERIALQLKGGCHALHATIRSLLPPLPGVRAVDLSSVPDHALIDIDTGMLSPQDLVEAVRRLKQDDDVCLVEPMQSCISASPLRHVDHPYSIDNGIGH